MLNIVAWSVAIALAIWGVIYFVGSLFEPAGARGVMKKQTSLLDAAITILGLALITFVVIYFFQNIIQGTTSNVFAWTKGVLDGFFTGTPFINLMP